MLQYVARAASVFTPDTIWSLEGRKRYAVDCSRRVRDITSERDGKGILILLEVGSPPVRTPQDVFMGGEWKKGLRFMQQGAGRGQGTKANIGVRALPTLLHY